MIEIKFEELKKQAVAYDEDINVGECDYEEEEDTWNIIHTSVIDSYSGQGIARRLVETIIENAEKRNKKLVADCWYAKKILDKKAE